MVMVSKSDSGAVGFRHNGDGWVLRGGGFVFNGDVYDVRPLVVLDPDDARVGGFRQWVSHLDGSNWPAAVRMAAALDDATQPPRIPEPGLWGVVEATRSDPMSTGETCEGKWFRTASMVCPWTHESGAFTADWDDLIDPALIREGVES